nr:D-alanyl-D-alanine endopeptidase precursor [Klebsiella pneumoniae]
MRLNSQISRRDMLLLALMSSENRAAASWRITIRAATTLLFAR